MNEQEKNDFTRIGIDSMEEDEKWAMLAQYAQQSEQCQLKRLAEEKLNKVSKPS